MKLPKHKKLTGPEREVFDALRLLESEGRIIDAGRPEPEIMQLATECEYHVDFAPVISTLPFCINENLYIEVKGQHTYEDSRIKFKFATHVKYGEYFLWIKQRKPTPKTNRVRWCCELWLNGERLEFMTVDSALDGIKWAIDNIAAQCNAGMGE